MSKVVKYFKPYHSNKEVRAVKKVLKSGHTTSGPKVKELEDIARILTNKKYAIAVNSATSGLFLALNVSVGKNSGYKNRRKRYIVTTPLTFVATIESIVHNGFFPYYCDISLDDYNMDLDNMDKTGILKVRDIAGYLPVNYAGNPCNLTVLDEKPIIIDAAHSALNKVDGAKGDILVFSFYANKIVHCGDGGVIVTNNEEYYEKIKVLMNHGRVNTLDGYTIKAVGHKMNLPDINAAVAIEQMKKIEYLTKIREEIALNYISNFKDLPGIVTNPFSIQNSYHLFPILVDNKLEFEKILRKNGVEYSSHYTPVPLFKPYSAPWLSIKERIPNAIYVFNRTISLPIYPDLKKKNKEE